MVEWRLKHAGQNKWDRKPFYKWSAGAPTAHSFPQMLKLATTAESLARIHSTKLTRSVYININVLFFFHVRAFHLEMLAISPCFPVSFFRVISNFSISLLFLEFSLFFSEERSTACCFFQFCLLALPTALPREGIISANVDNWKLRGDWDVSERKLEIPVVPAIVRVQDTVIGPSMDLDGQTLEPAAWRCATNKVLKLENWFRWNYVSALSKYQLPSKRC